MRHEQRYHNNDKITESCLLCKKIFHDNRKLQEHIILDHGPSEKFLLKESAFEETIVKYRLTFDDQELNFNAAQNKILDEIKETIRYEAARKTVVKVSLIFICQMTMQDLAGEKIESTLIPFRSNAFITNGLRYTGLSKKIKTSFRQQENSMEEFCESGSNWTFERAVAFDIELSGVKPLVIGSGEQTSQTKRNIMKHRKFLFDPKNKDEKCFLRCIHHAIDKDSDFDEWEKELNLNRIKAPISILQIRRFVKQNPTLNLKINILFRTTQKFIYPYECGIGVGSNVVNLLMVEILPFDHSVIEINRHFMLITNVNKYLSQKYYNGNTKKCSYSEVFYCLNCFNHYTKKEQLKEHERICLTRKGVIEITPEDETMRFKNYKHQHFQDYIAFLDFECLLSPEDLKNKCDNCKSVRCKCNRSFTETINHQEPFAYSFVILNAKNKIIHERTYVGEDAASDFLDHLLSCWSAWIKDLFQTTKPMIFTENDRLQFERSENCYLCKKTFNATFTKNRDHNHFTGKYLGAACLYCNLQRRRPTKLPIFLHNGSKYDFHFIIKALNKIDVGEISILPYNGENFRTIEFKGFKFLDSLAFLQASLDQLSEDLSKTNHDYKILKQTYLTKTNGKFDQIKLDHLIKKSYYPYEYCSSMKIMTETKRIPKIKDFYSTLREKTITKEEHQVARKVWQLFECEDLLDYTKIYCKLDTILLAEIFQKFRQDMHDYSNLDPSHYISLPAFAFDSMMKITRCKLSLIEDIDMIHLIESSIRGGVSFINNRFLDVKDDPESEIVYIDANVI